MVGRKADPGARRDPSPVNDAAAAAVVAESAVLVGTFRRVLVDAKAAVENLGIEVELGFGVAIDVGGFGREVAEEESSWLVPSGPRRKVGKAKKTLGQQPCQNVEIASV